jgi:hypothetical protein
MNIFIEWVRESLRKKTDGFCRKSGVVFIAYNDVNQDHVILMKTMLVIIHGEQTRNIGPSPSTCKHKSYLGNE